MKSLSVIACVAGGAAILVSACYPDFQFDEGGSGNSGNAGTGGTGGTPVMTSGMMTTGVGGMTGSTTGSTTSSTTGTTSSTTVTTGGMMVIPQVNCDAGNVLCQPGQVCCFDDLGPVFTDVCAQPGTCPGGYYQMECDDAGDCEMDESCCGTFDGLGVLTQTQCKTACNGAMDLPTCQFNAECGGGTCDEYYAGYKFCL